MKKIAKWLISGVAVVMSLGLTASVACATNGVDGVNGTNGTDGKSAYEIAVENGYVGTEAEWLESLKGAAGSEGSDGSKWFTGRGLPAGDTAKGAKEGDFYINLNTNTIYTLKKSGDELVWTLLVNVNEQHNVSVWDGTIPGWQAPYLSDAEVIANRPVSYVVNETAKTVDLYNAEAFAWFAYRSVIGKTGFEGYTVTLHCDIDLNNHMWVPIGLGARSNAPGVAFKGTFDGNGHTIYNFNSKEFYDELCYGDYVVHTSATETETETGYYLTYDNGTVQADIPVLVNGDNEFTYGLFANTYNATIRNLTIENVSIEMQTKYVNTDSNEIIPDSVGAFVGFALGNLTIENCVAGVKGGNDKIHVSGCVGGLIGRCYAGTGENDNGVIDGKTAPYGAINIINCTNNLDIKTLKGSSRPIKDEKGGGIIGYPFRFAELNVINCVNTGSVYAFYAGGLIGNRQGVGDIKSPVLIKNCVNYGDITGAQVGGILGRRYVESNGSNASFVINQCSNYGKITGVNVTTGNKTLYVGGLIGMFMISSARGVVTECFNYGDVSVEDDANATITAKVGGFFGELNISVPKNGIQGSVIVSGINCGNITATANTVHAYGFAYVNKAASLDLEDVLKQIYFFNNGVITVNDSVVADHDNKNI